LQSQSRIARARKRLATALAGDLVPVIRWMIRGPCDLAIVSYRVSAAWDCVRFSACEAGCMYAFQCRHVQHASPLMAVSPLSLSLSKIEWPRMASWSTTPYIHFCS